MASRLSLRAAFSILVVRPLSPTSPRSFSSCAVSLCLWVFPLNGEGLRGDSAGSASAHAPASTSSVATAPGTSRVEGRDLLLCNGALIEASEVMAETWMWVQCTFLLSRCPGLSLQALVCAAAVAPAEGGAHRVKWMRGSTHAASTSSLPTRTSAAAMASVTAAYTPIGIINHGGYIMHAALRHQLHLGGDLLRGPEEPHAPVHHLPAPSSDAANTGEGPSPTPLPLPPSLPTRRLRVGPGVRPPLPAHRNQCLPKGGV